MGILWDYAGQRVAAVCASEWLYSLGILSSDSLRRPNLKTFEAPEWMIGPFVDHGVSNDDYYLYGAGRALGLVKMAACALDDLGHGAEVRGDPQKIAEYHAYTGISADRTALDAIAGWCNSALQLGMSQGNQLNLSRTDFQSKVLMAQPQIVEYVKALGDLGKEIDKHRQRAQHREGLAIIRHTDSKKLGHVGGWYLMPNGLSGERADDLCLADLLRTWGDKIEGNLREIHKRVVQGDA